MNYTAEEKLEAARELLRESHDYLVRLPYHPLTARLVGRLAENLDDPTADFTRQAAEKSAAAREANEHLQTGGTYTPAGLVVIEASLFRGELTLSSKNLFEDVPFADKHRELVLRRLKRGEAFPLKRTGEDSSNAPGEMEGPIAPRGTLPA